MAWKSWGASQRCPVRSRPEGCILVLLAASSLLHPPWAGAWGPQGLSGARAQAEGVPRAAHLSCGQLGLLKEPHNPLIVTPDGLTATSRGGYHSSCGHPGSLSKWKLIKGRDGFMGNPPSHTRTRSHAHTPPAHKRKSRKIKGGVL